MGFGRDLVKTRLKAYLSDVSHFSSESLAVPGPAIAVSPPHRSHHNLEAFANHTISSNCRSSFETSERAHANSKAPEPGSPFRWGSRTCDLLHPQRSLMTSL